MKVFASKYYTNATGSRDFVTCLNACLLQILLSWSQTPDLSWLISVVAAWCPDVRPCRLIYVPNSCIKLSLPGLSSPNKTINRRGCQLACVLTPPSRATLAKHSVTRQQYKSRQEPGELLHNICAAIARDGNEGPQSFHNYRGGPSMVESVY